MPTVNFKSRPKGLQKQAIEANLKLAKQAIEKDVEKVIPTVFDIEYSTKRVSGEVVAFGEIIEGFVDKPIVTPYVQISKYVISTLVQLDKTSARALAYVINAMTKDSNVVIINVDAVPEISPSKRCVLLALTTLERLNLIKKTVDINKYAINHNEMFIGNKSNFIRTYNRLYDGRLANTTKQGRIILDFISK